MSPQVDLWWCEVCHKESSEKELLKIRILGEDLVVCKECSGLVKSTGRMEGR